MSASPNSFFFPMRYPVRNRLVALRLACVGLFLVSINALDLCATPPTEPLPSTCPQAYTVKTDKVARRLTLSTPYYQFDHDLTQGGAIARIRLAHGKAENLLIRPLETRLRDEQGRVFSDLRDAAPKVKHSKNGLLETVTVESKLLDENGRAAAGVRLKTRFEYHWGYVKIHKEFVVRKGGLRVTELCAVNTALAANLSDYGYREGLTEEEGAPPFSFGSCRWGKLNSDQSNAIRTNHVPRYIMLADAGVEGIEWFVGSDLHQWDLQMTGRRGQGQCVLQRSTTPAGIALSISPLQSAKPFNLTNSCAFDYYLGIPILEGHAQKPWFHSSFNRNRGEWVSTDEVKRWAESGVQTVHCHNDGDYYDDGLFWRDGAYPPYPDMDKYDKVISDCHDAGIRVATYFSNKELHPSTPEYQRHGSEWGRKNLKGNLQHNFFRGTNEFGAQMCLKSGWLPFLESSIDRVLTQHRLDGVYYDWNVALLCCNQQHQPQADSASRSAHWDIDELLQLMEWTRQRVGPRGLVIIHNTTTPMFATENFADDVVANEWGYGKWSGKGAGLADLPLEWSLVGARTRGVISYGQLDAQSPKRLHRLFALEALLSGVSPWPASPETFETFAVLKKIGDLGSCRFADWRNQAVVIQGGRCGSAVYSRRGESFLLLANLDEAPQEVRCILKPENLPFPIASPQTAILKVNQDTALNIGEMTRAGVKILIPGDSAVLVQVR